MTKRYSDKEVTEVLLQILEGDLSQYPNSGVDSVEYIGQGQYVVDLYIDDLRWIARGEQ